MPTSESPQARVATPNLRLPPRLKGVTFGPTGMRVIVNDEPRETAAGTLAALLEELGCAQEAAVAAAVDGQVVPRSRWSAHVLVPGAQVLVIRAAQGG
ncbi:MAG: Sulfur carrier protein ThiS [Verrucomicrobiota bacterium]